MSNYARNGCIWEPKHYIVFQKDNRITLWNKPPGRWRNFVDEQWYFLSEAIANLEDGVHTQIELSHSIHQNLIQLLCDSRAILFSETLGAEGCERKWVLIKESTRYWLPKSRQLSWNPASSISIVYRRSHESLNAFDDRAPSILEIGWRCENRKYENLAEKKRQRWQFSVLFSKRQISYWTSIYYGNEKV